MPKILSSKVKKNIPRELFTPHLSSERDDRYGKSCMLPEIKSMKGAGFTDTRIYRLLDANFNRAREGLRIVEDVFRFVLPKRRIALELKKIRLDLNGIVQKMYPQLIQARDINSDFGAKTKEKKRKNIKNLVMANFSRTQEALRVLEEFGKIISASLGEKFKKLRFRIYALEKDIFLTLERPLGKSSRVTRKR